MQESGLYGILICSVTVTVNFRMIFSRNAIECCYSVVKSLPICNRLFAVRKRKAVILPICLEEMVIRLLLTRRKTNRFLGREYCFPIP